VISSIVSRFDAMLVDVPGGLFAPLGFALAIRFAAPVHSPVFRGDHVAAAAGCALAFGSEIDDVTHASGPQNSGFDLRRRKNSVTPSSSPRAQLRDAE
jgi:hypothetical protein